VRFALALRYHLSICEPSLPNSSYLGKGGYEWHELGSSFPFRGHLTRWVTRGRVQGATEPLDRQSCKEL